MAERRVYRMIERVINRAQGPSGSDLAARRPVLAAVLVTALAAALLAGSGGIEAARERRYPPAEIADESLYIQSGTLARHLAIAYQTLAADLYWIRAVQYYGGTKRAIDARRSAAGPAPAAPDSDSDRYRLLYPLLDLTTSLDPRFNIAYRFGAIFLAEAPPAGPGRSDLAIALLDKGLRERPDKWEYMQDIGFVYYWWRHDFLTAAEWFDRASQVPGAPWFLKSLAANTRTMGGDRQSARDMWTAIRDSAEIQWLRHDAERRLAQLRAMDEIDILQRIADRYRAASGRPAESWAALVNARLLPPHIWVDPSGTEYELAGGRVRLSTASSLFPLPEASSVAVHR